MHPWRTSVAPDARVIQLWRAREYGLGCRRQFRPSLRIGREPCGAGYDESVHHLLPHGAESSDGGGGADVDEP